MITTIGRIADFQKGFAFKSKDYQDSGVRIIRVTNLNKRDYADKNCLYIDPEKANSYRRYELKTNDAVISTVGSWPTNPESVVGKVTIIPEEINGSLLNQNSVRLRAKGACTQDYLNYSLLNKEFFNYIVGTAQGSANQASITLEDIRKYEIKLPSSDCQKRVVSTLKHIDEKIAVNKKLNENLLQQAGAIFNKFYDESSNQQPFTSLINVLGGGTPKTGNPNFWNGPIPFFTPKDVGTPYTFQTEKYITESGLTHCNSRLYQKDTTFVTARGTVGKVSLAGTPMAMNQSCYALTSETVHPLLVYFYVLKAVASLKHKASGAVFDAIVTRDFDGETINVLSDDDAKSVLAIIKPMMEAIHNNSEENIRLATLRDSLLPRLMSGELDVSGLEF